MIILGLDTATPIASAAIIEHDRVLADCRVAAEPPESSARPAPTANHSQVLLPLIQSVLDRAGLAFGDLSAIVVTVGPGSFTGIRVGLSTAKGLAYGTGLAVTGVSTLAAMSRCVADVEGLVVPVIDARKGEVYTAVFKHRGGACSRCMEDSLILAGDFVDELRRRDLGQCLIVPANGSLKVADSLVQRLGVNASLLSDGASMSVAAGAALAGATAIANGVVGLAADLAPVYLQPTSAETQRNNST